VWMGWMRTGGDAMICWGRGVILMVSKLARIASDERERREGRYG
jgi:hypothetical protein